jgi:hypothetical protein
VLCAVFSLWRQLDTCWILERHRFLPPAPGRRRDSERKGPAPGRRRESERKGEAQSGRHPT